MKKNLLIVIMLTVALAAFLPEAMAGGARSGSQMGMGFQSGAEMRSGYQAGTTAESSTLRGPGMAAAGPQGDIVIIPGPGSRIIIPGPESRMRYDMQRGALPQTRSESRMGAGTEARPVPGTGYGYQQEEQWRQRSESEMRSGDMTREPVYSVDTHRGADSPGGIVSGESPQLGGPGSVTDQGFITGTAPERFGP